MSSVTYKIFSPEKNKKKLTSIYREKRACFSDMHGTQFQEGEFIQFFVEKILDPEMVYWYHGELLKIGFISELAETTKQYVFTIHARGAYLRTLSTLCSIRYLQEECFPEFVKAMHKWSKKFPEIDFIYLFQLSHYVKESYNYNHTFLPPVGVYNKFVRSLVSVETINKNMDAKRDTKLNSYTTGLDKVFSNGEPINATLDTSIFMKLIKSSDIPAALKMLDSKLTFKSKHPVEVYD